MGHGTQQTRTSGRWAQDQKRLKINVPENLKCTTPQAREFLKARSQCCAFAQVYFVETGGHDASSRMGKSQRTSCIFPSASGVSCELVNHPFKLFSTFDSNFNCIQFLITFELKMLPIPIPCVGL